jgi:hypothetical protein
MEQCGGSKILMWSIDSGWTVGIVGRVYGALIVQFSKNGTYPYGTPIFESSCSVKEMLQRHRGLYAGYRQSNTIRLNEPMCTTLQERRMRSSH